MSTWRVGSSTTRSPSRLRRKRPGWWRVRRPPRRSVRIAVMGTRGIPANYGGFETFAEELSTRLVRRGHRVTVYGRSHYVDPARTEYHGVRLVVLPAIRTKYLDTLSHTFLSSLHGCRHRYDVVLICNAA